MQTDRSITPNRTKKLGHLQLIYPTLIRRKYTSIGKARNSGQGGGVGFYNSSSVPFHRRTDVEDQNIECTWIEILFPKTKSFLIEIIYRPPDSSKHLFADFNCKFESTLSTLASDNKECIKVNGLNPGVSVVRIV